MYLLGIDLGGTNIAVGVTDLEGKILHKDSVKTEAELGIEVVTKKMADLCLKVIKDANVNLDDILSIGIGIPGTMDSKNGVVIYSNNIKISNFPIREKLSQYINKPVYISNDANCAGLGEVYAGAAKDYNSAVLVTLGTGVGGGIILDKKLWEGEATAAGEIGHIVIIKDGEECTCGRKGCWEAYSSATGLIRDTKRAMNNNPDSLMHKFANEEGKVSGKTAFKAARQNDKAGIEVVNYYIECLAEGIANLVNLLAPEAIIIGGGVCNEGDFLLNPLKESTEKKYYGGADVKRAVILTAQLGNDAGIVGAAMLYHGNK